MFLLRFFQYEDIHGTRPWACDIIVIHTDTPFAGQISTAADNNYGVSLFNVTKERFILNTYLTSMYAKTCVLNSTYFLSFCFFLFFSWHYLCYDYELFRLNVEIKVCSVLLCDIIFNLKGKIN